MSGISGEKKRAAALALHEYGLLKFGEFKLKSGIIAPFYIDLRIVQSFPEAFHTITELYAELIKDVPEGTLLAGIPEAGIPLATAVGYETNRPLIQPRAKVKDHGIGNLIEGNWQAGDNVAIIDDLVAKGDSKIEALDRFKQCNLIVEGFYLLLDREMGGKEVVEAAGYKIKAAMTITEALTILLEEKKIEQSQYDDMISFTRSHQ